MYRELVAHPDDSARQIEFYWTTPEGTGPWPAIVYVHPHLRDPSKGSGQYVAAGVLGRMAGRGYVAAAISQPGYGASDGPADFCGPITQAAVTRVLEILRGNPAVKPDGIVLYGYSRGAIVASMVATRDHRLAGLVLGGGVYDLADAHARLPAGSVLGDNIARESGATPEAFRARSSLLHAESIRAPTLILHGEDDDVGPVDQARAMAQKLAAAGVQVTLEVFPATGHHIPLGPRNQALYRFLAQIVVSGGP